MIHLSNAPARERLLEHADRWNTLSLADLVVKSAPARQGLHVEAAGVRLDFSRQRLDEAVLADLLALAEQTGLPEAIAGLLDGKELNASEGRAAWHTALRAAVPPAPVRDQILEQRERQRAFVDAVCSGELCNAAGETYTDVINIGIGGSDLGPRLLSSALVSQAENGLRPHYVGNLDSAALASLLAELNPRRCLCIVVSKSFTTQETRLCAEFVREWLRTGGGEVGRQFVAVTAMPEKACDFGLERPQIFPMWDWVGGRFSAWSAVGLSTALALGWARFEQLLQGAEAMDRHFAEAPLAQNLPVIWALIGIWNRNFLDYPSNVTAVYSDLLAQLPNWLQQLDMESNGKSIGRDGSRLPHACAVVQWGGVGTSAQHAFFQLLHQGREAHPVDFILPLHVPGADVGMQRALLTNALAQSAALSQGRRLDPASDLSAAQRAWRECPGDRPSNLVWLRELGPRGLGALLAAYEHRCFVKGWIWGLNSFDQFGVELGKTLTQGIERAMAGDESAWPDPLLATQARFLNEL